MISSLNSAASAIHASTSVADVSANNIANINTPNFKARMAHLSELSTGGVQYSTARLNDSIGSLITPPRHSDYATFGVANKYANDTYMPVYNNFATDGFGNLRSPDGDILFTSTGSNVRVDADGYIHKNASIIGQIVPTNDFQLTGATILDSYTTPSNVNISSETVNSIANYRYFQANVNVVQTSNEMLGSTLNITA